MSLSTTRQPEVAPPAAPAAVSSAPVSAVVVSYHTGEILFGALDALLGQPDLARVVLVDNGNPEHVKAQLKERAASESRLTLLQDHGNIGFASGCNIGAANTDTEFVLFLNPDCVLAPGAVAALRDEAAALPALSLVTPRLVNPDGSDQRGARREVLTPWRALVETLRLDRLAPDHPYFVRFNQHESALPSDTAPIKVGSGACMLMRRSTFDALGGFDERYFLHVEDIDLCVRLLRAGGSPYFCPHIRAVHHQGSSHVPPVVVEWHKSRSFRLYFRKNFAGYYPPGFVRVVNAFVLFRLALLIPRRIVGGWFRRSTGSAWERGSRSGA